MTRIWSNSSGTNIPQQISMKKNIRRTKIYFREEMKFIFERQKCGKIFYDFRIFKWNLKKNWNDQWVSPCIPWSFVGLESYPGIYEKHLRSAHGFCLIYSPNDSREDSLFEDIDLYWEEIRLIRKSRDFPLIFLSHQTSQHTKRTPEQAKFERHLTRRYGAPVARISPDKDFCVQNAFRVLMKEVRKREPKNDNNSPRNLLQQTSLARLKGRCSIV